MSTAPGLIPSPKTTPATPTVVPGAPKPPRRNPWFMVIAGILAVSGLGWFLWSRQAADRQTANEAAVQAATPTAAVRTGDLIRTIRLTGSTGAERFASLLVPQLRGSRSDSLREAKLFQSPGADYNIGSTSGGRGTGGGALTPASGSNSSGGSATSGGSSGSNQVASTMGQSTGGTSAALQSATSRVGGGKTPPPTSGRGTSGGGANSPSNAVGDSGLGSTAAMLAGTGTAGGGGNNGGDYGLVLQSAAKPGSMVKKGAQVAEFDRVNMMNRLEDYRASVAQMDSSFEKLKAEVEVQRTAHQQTVENSKAALDQASLDLKTIPVLGRLDTERVKLAAEEAAAKYKQLQAEGKLINQSYAAQVREAELQLKQAHLELKRAESNADRMIMQAPINGLVVMQTIFRGSELAQIQAGDQLWPGMRYMQIVDISSMVINAAVNQVDAESVRVGAKAKVRFDAFPDLVLTATVEAIGAMTKPGNMRASYVKEIPVVLRMNEMDPRVIPDLSVSVDVQTAAERQVAIAPAGAVFRDGGAGTSPYVFVRSQNGWERRPVEIGLSSWLEVAIRSGLRPGETVATARPPEPDKNQS